jgi:hypothetical protein
MVSAVAARYARWYLDARTWHARTQWLALGLMLAGLVVAAGLVGGLSGTGRADAADKALIWLVAVVIAAAVVLPYATRKMRLTRRYRLELANKPTADNAALAAGAPRPEAGLAPPPGWTAEQAGWVPGPGQAMLVRYDRRQFVRQSAWLVLVLALIVTAVTGQALSAGTSAGVVVLGLFGAAVALLLVVPRVVMLVRWVLPNRPVVELDADGVHLPSIACDLPWPALAEVRLSPLRYARRGEQQPAVVVAFMPRDPGTVLSTIRAGRLRRRRLERSLRVYGTPLSFSDHATDRTGEQIAAAAVAYAPVPVRRL